jgi:hypothetical protein
VRPFSDVEVEARCRVATSRPPGEPQITLGQNKSFTFDEVYFMDSEQAPIFAEAVQPLIDGSVPLLSADFMCTCAALLLYRPSSLIS